MIRRWFRPDGRGALAPRLVEWVERVARSRPSASTRRILLILSVLLFLGAAVWGVLRLPPLKIEIPWLAAALATAVLTPVTNAMEYWLAGRWVGVSVPPGEALSITVQASAANLSPLPGAALVRGQALYRRGARPGATARALAAIGIGWLAVAFAAAGLALAGRGSGALGTVFVSGGVVFGGLVILLLRVVGSPAKAVFGCLGVEAASVTVATARLYFVLAGLGIDAELSQVLVLPVAGAVANAAGLFPGGLGLRELLAGGIAPLVGLPVEAGVVGAAVDRVLGLAILGVVTGLLMVAFRRMAGFVDEVEEE